MTIDYALFIPEFIMAGAALLVIAIDLFLPRDRKQWLPWLSLAGIGTAMGSTFTVVGESEVLYGGLFYLDNFAIFFKFFLMAIAGVMVVASAEYVNRNLQSHGEFYGILLFSVLAMMVMVSAGEILTAYIALELFSFTLYVLAGYATHQRRSIEAGIKYILAGAFSSALLLYGVSLIYGSVGTTVFTEISTELSSVEDIPIAFLAGLVLVVVGLGFKVTAVPFHMWAPDVYEGAPTPVTAYLSTAAKAAAFALMLRMFASAFAPAIDEWRAIVAAMAVMTMLLGNLVAIAQVNIKRMLAYSSIGQAGYLLLGIVALTPLASNGLIFHLVGYSATNFAVFTAVIAYQNMTGHKMIDEYGGLGRSQPFLAFVISIAFFSLAGLPIFSGFATKFYLFTAVADEGLLWLVIVAATASLISLYYYLMVIKRMYLNEPADPTPLRLDISMRVILAGLIAAVVFLGIYPGPLLDLIEDATRALPL